MCACTGLGKIKTRDTDFVCACTGLGKIKTRDNAAVWGTDQECKLRQPDDPFYKKFAAECSRVQIAIDVFAMGCALSLRSWTVNATQKCECAGDLPSAGMQLVCDKACKPGFVARGVMVGEAFHFGDEQCTASAGASTDMHHLSRLQV